MPSTPGPEGTNDIDHFELAVTLGRVMIANDKHMKAIAEIAVDPPVAVPPTNGAEVAAERLAAFL